ncbi:hypothetical protein [Kiloniella laminariae]|uniref:hypothetical protein n=1 Tax=Kiloniella laminariae TaxID=454162 RepID=UPI00037EA983|nr:hypothetical protein [Kiloniella laminariae]
MKKLPPFALLAIFFLMLDPASSYAKTLKVCTVEIPGGMTKDKEGPQPLLKFYQQTIEIVQKKTGYEFELSFAPALRCQNLFFKKEIDIIWPFIITDEIERIRELGYSFLPVYSMPIIMGGYYIFTKQEDPVAHHIKDLEGKTAVSARGYGVPLEYEDNAQITKSITNGNEQIPKMILGNRVDAGIIQTGWVPTLERQGLLEGLHHGEVIDFWGGSFTFQPDEEGIALSNLFSNAILKLVTQGVYKELMTDAPYYIPDY